MTAALTPYQEGLITPFAAVGAILVVGALIWLTVVMFPEGVWWTVRRLPLHSQSGRDRTASVVAASRRAYVLRIPFGVRLIVALGADPTVQEETMEALLRGRRDAEAVR